MLERRRYDGSVVYLVVRVSVDMSILAVACMQGYIYMWAFLC